MENFKPKRITSWEYYDGPTEGLVEFENSGALHLGAFKELFSDFAQEWRLFLVTLNENYSLGTFEASEYPSIGYNEGCVVASATDLKLMDLKSIAVEILTSSSSKTYISLCYEMFRKPVAWAESDQTSPGHWPEGRLNSVQALNLIQKTFGEDFDVSSIDFVTTVEHR